MAIDSTSAERRWMTKCEKVIHKDLKHKRYYSHRIIPVTGYFPDEYDGINLQPQLSYLSFGPAAKTSQYHLEILCFCDLITRPLPKTEKTPKRH